MDEQKKEQEVPENKEKPQSLPTRSLFLMMIAGAYLIYTGYMLCKNVVEGLEGASWGFFAAGVFFIVVGAGMLFHGIKSYSASAKEKKLAAEMENQDTEQLVQSEAAEAEQVETIEAAQAAEELNPEEK